MSCLFDVLWLFCQGWLTWIFSNGKMSVFACTCKNFISYYFIFSVRITPKIVPNHFQSIAWSLRCHVTSYDVKMTSHNVKMPSHDVSFQSFCYWFLLFWWIFSMVCLHCSPRKPLSLLFSHFFFLSYNATVHKFVWKSFQSLQFVIS